MPFPGMLLMFGLFIISCGWGHLVDAVMTQWPAYRFSGLIKLETALVSWATVIALVPLVPKALAMRSPEALEREVAARTAELTRANEALAAEVQERKRTEEALREKEEFNKRIVESSFDCITLLDLEGRLLSMNAGGRRLMGIGDLSPHLNRPWTGWWQDEDRPAAEAAVAAARGGGTGTFQGYGASSSGEARWWEVVITPMLDRSGQPERLLAVSRDISAGKQVTEELLQQRELLRSITDNADSALMLLDIEGRITFMNPAFTRITGYTEEDTRGKTAHEVIHYKYPDGRPFPIEECPIDRSYWDLKPVRGHEEIFVRKDGTLFPVVAAVAPLAQDGKPVGGVLEFRDVTKEKEAEAALEEQSRRKDEFLAMLSHELRNPLAPILNAVHTLKAVGPQDSALRRQRDIIERQARHMARLVDDLLDVSRVSRGNIVLRKEIVDLKEVMDRALETVQPAVSVRQQELSLSLPPEPLYVEGDLTRLEQVLVNLLNNAAKYTEPGGRISLTAERKGDDAMLRIRDTGIGIPPSLLPHVFDLFAQGDRSLARSEGGLGIGLTIVKHLVEMHGGGIAAYSEGEGRGSEFVVRLPILASGGAAVMDGPRDAAAPTDRPLRILVVEDNQDAAETIADLLGLWGHHAEVAHNGDEALDAARRVTPQVVISDIGLPGMDGYQVARRLREDAGATGALMIALTGYGQEEDRRRAREAGFRYHLTKPVDPAELQKLLSRLAGEIRKQS